MRSATRVYRVAEAATVKVRSAISATTSHDANVDGAAEKVIASYTLPAGFFSSVGDILEFKLIGRIIRTGSGPTIQLRLRYGGLTGTIIATTNAYSTSIAAVTNGGILINGLAICKTTGATGTLRTLAEVGGVLNSAALFTDRFTFLGDGTANYTGALSDSGALDLTASKDFVLTSTWGAATAGNIIDISGGYFVKRAA